MNNQVKGLFLFLGMLIIGIWGVSTILTINDTEIQLAIIGTLLVTFVAVTFKMSLPFDFKMLMFVFAGYCIGGKGFAYLSPVAPIYIGEIFLAIATLGYLLRTKLNFVSSIKEHPINLLFIIANVYVLFRIFFVDYKNFGMLAVRDSSMIYYTLIALITSKMLANEKNFSIFKKVLPWLVAIGYFSYSIVFRAMGKKGVLFYAPHVDVAVPLTVAIAITGLYYIGRNRYQLGMIMLACAMYPILTDKTAFLFSFVTASTCVIFFGKMKELLKLFIPLTMIVVIVSITFQLIGWSVSDILDQSDFSQTFTDLDSGKRSTTAWRIEWWRTVFVDTYEQSPVLGLGLGADITSNFIYNYMGIHVTESHSLFLTRYPHNVFFTIFGRLGFLGVTFFVLYAILFLRFCKKFCNIFIAIKDKEPTDIMLVSIVLAGFFNAFVQSTYENPYAGIVHWICLGAMMARYTSHKLELRREAMRHDQ